MYLDALFIISHEGMKIMENMDTEMRFNYVLGLGGDSSFVEHLIDMEDFGITNSSFYSLLLSQELNLKELDYRNVESVYEDNLFYLFMINYSKIKGLQEKMQNLDNTYIGAMFKIGNYIRDNDFNQSTIEKYTDMKELINETYQKNANLLVIIRR